MNKDDIIKKLEIAYGVNKFTYEDMIYVNRHTIFTLNCIKHDHKFPFKSSSIIPVNNFNSKNTKYPCPKCRFEATGINQEFSYSSTFKKVKYKKIKSSNEKGQLKIIFPETIRNYGKQLSFFIFCSPKFLPYEEAQIFVRDNKISTYRDYKKWHKNNKIDFLPSNPHRTYDPWSGYDDFFFKNFGVKMSKGERKICEWLNKKNIHYVFQKKFNDCKDINTLPFDFYLPKYNVTIEFDGIQHFMPIKYFGDDVKYMKQKRRDKIKSMYCLNNNITLLRISYLDEKNKIIETILSGFIENRTFKI